MISVVVPVYNMKKYLPRCMKTLLAQGIDDYEIILIDDGSTDGSAALCDRYATENPEIVRCIHKKNGGLSSARNTGILEANGTYIIFPDPDDWVEENYLDSFQRLIKENRADLYCTGYFVEYEKRVRLSSEEKQCGVLTSNEALEIAIVPGGMGGFSWNKLFRLDLIQRNQIEFLDDVGTTEDLDFLARYLRYCDKVCYEPKLHTYHYFQRNGAATHQTSFKKTQVDSLKTYKKIIDDEANSPAAKQAAKWITCNTAMNLLVEYHYSNCNDCQIYERILHCQRQYIIDYLQSPFGLKRKAQAVLAYLVPRSYAKIKTIWRHN